MLDVVVIGLGGVGSFCLRSLTKRARGLTSVAGIEQYARLHEYGSSHGGSRIYRKAYFEGSTYVPWIQYSHQAFQEMDDHKKGDDDTKCDLLENCGTLIIEERGGPLVEACSASAQEWNIVKEFLTNADLRHRYPQFRLASDNKVGLFEPGGGFIRPEKAMEAALNEAELNGATIYEGLIVDRLVEVDNHVEIHTLQNNAPSRVIQAKAVIVASGSWTSKLIPSWAPYLTVTRQVQAWINVADDDSYLPRSFPTWCMSTPHHPITLYGVPRDPFANGAPSGWLKFGLHGRDDHVADPSSMSRVVTELERNELLDAANVSLHCGSQSSISALASAKPCLYTMSPDGHFILGRPVEYQRVVAAAGLSGHGFKMTPALGEMLCDLVLGQDFTKWNADSLSPSRFVGA